MNTYELEWISVQERPPTKDDSPILAIESLDYFTTKALEYIDGWDGMMLAKNMEWV